MSPANLIGSLIFGSIGFVAFMYGKRNSNWKPMVMGVGLMAYPYFVPDTLALYLVGTGICTALYFWRD